MRFRSESVVLANLLKCLESVLWVLKFGDNALKTEFPDVKVSELNLLENIQEVSKVIVNQIQSFLQGPLCNLFLQYIIVRIVERGLAYLWELLRFLQF